MRTRSDESPGRQKRGAYEATLTRHAAPIQHRSNERSTIASRQRVATKTVTKHNRVWLRPASNAWWERSQMTRTQNQSTHLARRETDIVNRRRWTVNDWQKIKIIDTCDATCRHAWVRTWSIDRRDTMYCWLLNLISRRLTGTTVRSDNEMRRLQCCLMTFKWAFHAVHRKTTTVSIHFTPENRT